jgi:hypothetical protein
MENGHPQLDLEHRLACTSSMEHLSGGLQPLKLPNARNVVHLSRMQAEPSGIHSQSACQVMSLDDQRVKT